VTPRALARAVAWTTIALATSSPMVLASDFHATDAALAVPFERRSERDEKMRLSAAETQHASTTPVGQRLRGPDRAGRALEVLESLERRYVSSVDDAKTEDELTRAKMDLEVVRTAIVSANAAMRSGGATYAGERAALGQAREDQVDDVWEGSGGLMDSIASHRRGVPGSVARRVGPSSSRERDEDAVARFFSLRRKRQASAPPKPKISTQAAKERLAPAAPWFKPKQPDVYWDVDVAKIQRAREAVEETRKKQKEYDFEITDMPIKALRKKARLGAAGEEEPEVKENDVEELGITKGEDLLRNATIHDVDDMFSDQVDSWTAIAMESFHNATRRARQSIAKISRQAIKAEESLLMSKMDVRMYVDFADPYSLELVLGAYQKLSSMQLGPVDWNIVPFVNVGQFHNTSVNCMYSGHGRHLSCTTNAIAACAANNVGKLQGGMQAFTSCYGMQLLKLEAQDAFKYGRHEETLNKVEDRCCRVVIDAVSSHTSRVDVERDEDAASVIKKNTKYKTCETQKVCAFNGAGYELLKKNAAELGRMNPRHKWIPWITIDGKVACRKKCNLQATVRRRICNARRGALPEDCPKFPWAEALYDEPEISFGGLAAASAAIIIVSGSLFVLMREAGMNPLQLYSGVDTASEEKARLLPLSD